MIHRFLRTGRTSNWTSAKTKTTATTRPRRTLKLRTPGTDVKLLKYASQWRVRYLRHWCMSTKMTEDTDGTSMLVLKYFPCVRCRCSKLTVNLNRRPWLLLNYEIYKAQREKIVASSNRYLCFCLQTGDTINCTTPLLPRVFLFLVLERARLRES